MSYDTGQALIDGGYVSPTIGTAFYTLSQSCPYHFGVVTEGVTQVSLPRSLRCITPHKAGKTHRQG